VRHHHASHHPLVPAPTCVRVFRLPYADLATMLSDETLLVEEERFD
jgi:hypothetical protein